MRVHVDKRSREVNPAPDAERAGREAAGTIAAAELAGARALSTIEKERTYIRAGYASAQAWAEANGFGDQQARRLLALGRVLAAAPELESLMRSGAVSSDSVLAVGRVLCEPALELSAAERQAWLEKACDLPPRQLREEAHKAVEEARQGEPTFPMRFHVTWEAKKGFARSRLLMSKGEPCLISEGQTFARLVRDWLERHDPRLKPLPARHSGSTRGRRSRYRTKQVDAIVERRSGGTCEICGVRRAVEKIHLKEPHALGGSREADNIGDSCRECHVMVDAGIFRFSRFDEEGRPQFTFHPARLEGRPEQPGEVRERGPPRYRARRRRRARVGSAVAPFG